MGFSPGSSLGQGLTVAGGSAMALSMDEQRILDEMERRLADDDPRLASKLASLGRPRLRATLRSPRARVLGTLLALALIVAVALMVYAMMPFRPGPSHTPAKSPATHRPVGHTHGSAATAS
jgi:hypothetical protein